MRLNKFLSLAAAAVMVLWGGSAVRAAQIPWAHPSGSAANFDYNNGGTSDQLFVPAGTDPVVTPTGLAFFPSAFKAQAGNGATQQTSDKVSFDIHAHPGFEVDELLVNEFGDYTIQGSGPNTAVKVFGSIFLTNLDTNQVVSAALSNVSPVGINSGQGIKTGQNTWQGSIDALTVPPIPSGWKNVRVELDNILQASSDPGTNAFIEKKVITPGVTITIIQPEPGSIALLAIGCGALLGRRRRIV